MRPAPPAGGSTSCHFGERHARRPPGAGRVRAPAASSPSLPAAGPSGAIEGGPAALLDAARTLLPVLEAGRPLDAATLRDAVTRAHRASGAEGAWVWKDAYEAAEVAVVMFVRRYGRAMRQRAGAGAEGPRRMLDMLAAVAALEPSAGTGLLAVMAECALGKSAEGRLHLNEIAAVRAGLLARLFPQHPVTVTVSPEATPVPANASVTGLACIDTRWTACAPPPAVTAKSPGTGVDRRSSVSE